MSNRSVRCGSLKQVLREAKAPPLFAMNTPFRQRFAIVFYRRFRFHAGTVRCEDRFSSDQECHGIWLSVVGAVLQANRHIVAMSNRLVQRTTRLEPHLARSMESAKTRLSTASAPRHLTETAAESVTAADVLGGATFKLKWTSF